MHNKHKLLPSNSIPELKKWWTWPALLVSGICTAAGPLVASAGFVVSNDVVSHLLVTGGVVLLIVGIALASVQQRKSREHVETVEYHRSRNLTAFNDTHAAMSKAVGDLIRSKQQVSDVEAFFSVSLVSAPSLMPTDGFRICIYQLDRREQEEQSEKSPNDSEATQILKRVDYGGRADAPRAQFSEETSYGRHLINIAKGTSPWVVSDPEASDYQDIIDRKPASSWRSFLAIPLKFNQEPRGVITIDSREKIDLTQEHISIGWAISDYITLGMDLGKAGAQDPSPELASIDAAIRIREAQKSAQ